ncbi:MAG: sulfotransferase [Anaerolineales bacterium]
MVNAAQDSSPILVTGAHRSGTTWVGKMLAASRRVAYISEPLNVWHRPGVLRTPVRHWYTYICEQNEGQYLPALQETLAYRYHTWLELRSLRSRKDALRMGRDFSIFLAGRLLRRRPLLKDPFAVFSAPWFFERLGCQVVISVRHPAAFTSSLKRLGWDFDFEDLLAQPLLMQDWLEPYRQKMEHLQSRPADVVVGGALLWRMIYQTVDEYRRRFPEFLVVRHEDLSRQPVQGFHALYRSLGLSFDERVEQRIRQSSSPENPQEISRQAVHAVQLDSRANLDNWKRRLTGPEIERVHAITHDVAELYYSDQEWQ